MMATGHNDERPPSVLNRGQLVVVRSCFALGEQLIEKIRLWPIHAHVRKRGAVMPATSIKMLFCLFIREPILKGAVTEDFPLQGRDLLIHFMIIKQRGPHRN
jgi:hypothetical protein